MRSRQAEVVIEIDALEAQDAEVRATLAEIERNVARQRSELQAAERAQAQGEAELAQATQAVADAQQRIDDLNVQADRLVVDSFVNPPSDYALEPPAGGIHDRRRRHPGGPEDAGEDADLLERLDQAHESLAAEQAKKEDAAGEAKEAQEGGGNSTTWRPHLANSRPSPRTSRSA